MVSQHYSPVMKSSDLGRTLQILLKPELKGLSDGANDILGQPITTLQNVTSCGSKGHRPIRGRHWSYSGSFLLRVKPRSPGKKRGQGGGFHNMSWQLCLQLNSQEPPDTQLHHRDPFLNSLIYAKVKVLKKKK